jgi:hypothetical protein
LLVGLVGWLVGLVGWSCWLVGSAYRTSEYGSYVVGAAVGVGYGTMLAAYAVFRWEGFAATLTENLWQRFYNTLACLVVLEMVVVPTLVVAGVWVAIRLDRLNFQQVLERIGHRTKREEDYQQGESLNSRIKYWIMLVLPPLLVLWLGSILIWFLPVYFRSQDLHDKVYEDFVNLPTMLYEIGVGIFSLIAALVWLVVTRNKILLERGLV